LAQEFIRRDREEFNIPVHLAEDVKRNSSGISDPGGSPGIKRFDQNDNIYKPIKEEAVIRIISASQNPFARQ